MEKENTEGRFFTRIKWNPLIVLPAEGFGIELRALVLFEADSAVWARLGKHPDNNKETAREPGSRSKSLQILELQANMCKNAQLCQMAWMEYSTQQHIIMGYPLIIHKHLYEDLINFWHT